MIKKIRMLFSSKWLQGINIVENRDSYRVVQIVFFDLQKTV